MSTPYFYFNISIPAFSMISESLGTKSNLIFLDSQIDLYHYRHIHNHKCKQRCIGLGIDREIHR